MMNRNPMIPPNFVTLKQLKEKREEEERLRKLKEEEEEEERERIRKLKEEEAAKHLNDRPKTLGPRKPGPIADPKAQLSGYARSVPDPTNTEAAVQPERRTTRRRANPKARPSENGRSDPNGTNLEGGVAAENGGPDAKPFTLEASKEEDELKQKERKKKKKKKKALKERQGEMTETSLGLNGSEAVSENGFETKKRTADVDGSEKIKVSGGGSCRPVRIIGSRSDPIADVEKRVSDLRIDGWYPNANRRGRGSGYGGCRGGRGFSGRGRGESGMMWVRKTTES